MLSGANRWPRDAFLAAVALGLLCTFAFAQLAPEAEMFPLKIAGRTYELREFDKNGDIERRRIIKVSPPIPASNGAIELQIEIRALDESDEAAGGKTVRWVCSPNASQMAMPIFILAGDTLRSDSQLEVIGSPIIYPTDLSSSTSLSDVELTIRIKKGMLSLLGTRSRFQLTGRRVTKRGPGNDEYIEITSDGAFKAYLAGVPVKRMRFTIRERLDRSGEISRYEIDFANGNRSVLTLVQEPQPAGGGAAGESSRTGSESAPHSSILQTWQRLDLKGGKPEIGSRQSFGMTSLML